MTIDGIEAAVSGVVISSLTVNETGGEHGGSGEGGDSGESTASKGGGLEGGFFWGGGRALTGGAGAGEGAGGDGDHGGGGGEVGLGAKKQIIKTKTDYGYEGE